MYLKKMRFGLTISFLTLIPLLSCDYVSENQNIKIENVNTKFLGHRGIVDEISNTKENTIESVSLAFEKLAGAEIDVQMSLDKTVWLFHDSNLPYTNTSEIKCIVNATDLQINEFLEKYNLKLTKLEEVLEYMQNNNIKKYLSLDVKAYYDSKCIENNSVTQTYLEELALKICNMSIKYNLEDYVMVETDYKYFLEQVKQINPKITCYLLSYSDFKKSLEVAMKKNFDGISFNCHDTSFNALNVHLAKLNQIKIQAWTPNNAKKIDEVFNLNPDFIQTDNFNYIYQNYICDTTKNK